MRGRKSSVKVLALGDPSRWSDVHTEEETYFAWEGHRVATSKRGYLELLLATAGQIAGCERLHGKRRLACLARHCDIDRTTLLRELGQDAAHLPSWGTLGKLEEHTEVSLVRWLVALGRVTTAQMAAALGQEAPQIILSPGEREWLRLIRSWTPQEDHLHFGYVSRVRGLNLDPERDRT